MPLNRNMRSLAVVAFFSCIAVTLASKKESVCCTEVSARRITVPIIGFMVHQARPPCVKAVMFFTSEGVVCSHWKETWVKEKVTELRRLQAIEKNRKKTTTSSATQTPESTSLTL